MTIMLHGCAQCQLACSVKRPVSLRYCIPQKCPSVIGREINGTAQRTKRGHNNGGGDPKVNVAGLQHGRFCKESSALSPKIITIINIGVGFIDPRRFWKSTANCSRKKASILLKATHDITSKNDCLGNKHFVFPIVQWRRKLANGKRQRSLIWVHRV